VWTWEDENLGEGKFQHDLMIFHLRDMHCSHHKSSYSVKVQHITKHRPMIFLLLAESEHLHDLTNQYSLLEKGLSSTQLGSGVRIPRLPTFYTFEVIVEDRG
jgi:hypothetical protein